MIEIQPTELRYVCGGSVKGCMSDIKIGAGAGAIAGAAYGGRFAGWRGVPVGALIGTFGGGLFTAAVSAACHGRGGR